MPGTITSSAYRTPQSVAEPAVRVDLTRRARDDLTHAEVGSSDGDGDSLGKSRAEVGPAGLESSLQGRDIDTRRGSVA